MNIIDRIRQKVLQFLRLDHLAGDPNSERLTYINNPNDLKTQTIEEARVWYLGDGNELLNYYTKEENYGNADNPAYNRNRANYFWGISSTETNIKRVHSGVPRAIIDTLSNAVGFPILSANYKGEEIKLNDLLEQTQLKKKTMQQQLPLTMAVGYGAWKVTIRGSKKYGEHPILQFYEAKDVEFIESNGDIIGLIFKDYYSHKDRDYILLDTRRINEKGNSSVEYELFRLSKNDDVTEVELDEIPELANLKDIELPNYKHILGVPCRFFHDCDNPTYGRSIYQGKYDLFDDLDQSLSQRSQTSRVSTPVEYYPVDLLERTPNGRPLMPKAYNRQYVQKAGIPDGDGRMDSQIQTTQPQLNFAQYNEEQKAILDMILTGILSPATMGIDVAKKDNADAQREKEKVTIMTRNNIIDSETEILKELLKVTIAMNSYMMTGNIPVEGLDVSVKYCEFANPSFESLSSVLLPLWQAGAMSDEMFVEKLYGDSLSEEEKQKEIEALKANKQQDDLSLGAFDTDGQERMAKDMGQEEGDPSQVKASQRQLPYGDL